MGGETSNSIVEWLNAYFDDDDKLNFYRDTGVADVLGFGDVIEKGFFPT